MKWDLDYYVDSLISKLQSAHHWTTIYLLFPHLPTSNLHLHTVFTPLCKKTLNSCSFLHVRIISWLGVRRDINFFKLHYLGGTISKCVPSSYHLLPLLILRLLVFVWEDLSAAIPFKGPHSDKIYQLLTPTLRLFAPCKPRTLFFFCNFCFTTSFCLSLEWYHTIPNFHLLPLI